MAEPVFRAPPADTVRVVPLDEFTAIYHRASGITHLITAPAPEILVALGEVGLTRRELIAQLAADYEIGDADERALAARLDELVASGMVSIA